MNARVAKKIRQQLRKLTGDYSLRVINGINSLSQHPLPDRLRICWRILRKRPLC